MAVILPDSFEVFARAPREDRLAVCPAAGFSLVNSVTYYPPHIPQTITDCDHNEYQPRVSDGCLILKICPLFRFWPESGLFIALRHRAGRKEG